MPTLPYAAGDQVLATEISEIGKSAGLYAASAAGTDTYAITVVPAIGSYMTGMVFRFKADVGNTGAATLNVSGKGAISIVKNGSEALETGDILAGQFVEVHYDGTNMQLLSRSVGQISCKQIVLPFAYPSETTSLTLTANTVFTFPIALFDDILCTKMVIFVGTGSTAGRHIGIGLYSMDGNTKYAATPAIDTPGGNIAYTGTLAAAVALRRGNYILAVCSDNSSLGVRGIAASTNMHSIINQITSRTGTGANAASGGVLPSTLGAISSVSQIWPVVMISAE